MYVEELPSLDSNEVKIIGITDYEFDKDREFYITKLNKPIVKGNYYRISMDFVSRLNDNLKGFYRSHYKNNEGKKE